MAGNPTPPGGDTRFIQTTRGLLSLGSIHPFNDFNGRTTRLFLRELLRRLELPPVDLVPTDAAGASAYFAALRSGDGNDWRPLMKLWEQRFEQFGETGSP